MELIEVDKVQNILNRLDLLREKLTDTAFLSNQGLSNEVGLYVFAYRPEAEMPVRYFLRSISEKSADGQCGFRAISFDLYEILLDICRERRILERIPQMEAQRGGAFTLAQIQRIAPPEAYIERMQYGEHRRGDVVMLSGVGRVFPYMRSHNILNNLQHVFSDIPVILFYPGNYSGQTLTLFERFMDDNYYRAFNLV